MKTLKAAFAASVALAVAGPAWAEGRPHNIVLFVADGLRGALVDEQTAPAMAGLARQGVWMRNSHSLFPTFTTANASGMATGHQIGDTGDFSNAIYTGFPAQSASGSSTPFLESDPVLDEVDDHFGGNYLNEETILKLARNKGFGTAAVGKLGPTLIFDHTGRKGESERGADKSIVIDDQTGMAGKGVPLSKEVADRLTAAGLPLVAPSRGDNGKPGDAAKAGTKVANLAQQDYFASAATRAVLPLLAARDKPFVLVFWSRDPDGTQHNQGDSLLKLTPGINGPTSLAAIRNADDDLARIRATLSELGIADQTNIIVTSDHGFSTISKESETSDAAKRSYADTPAGLLPVGFLAHDLARALAMPMLDPDAANKPVGDDLHPVKGDALIGGDKDNPKVVVAANGGSDLIYVPDGDKEVAKRVVDALLAQDYVSGVFVNSKLGKYPGTLSLDDIKLEGTAVTPHPAIAVSFRSFDTVCGEPTRCGVEIADTPLQQGQGMHGSFSRADTFNFMAAVGPDFKASAVNLAPTSNADIGKTIAKLMALDAADKGPLLGRSIDEALVGGKAPEVTSEVIASEPAANGLKTVINLQRVGDISYFDAAGFPGRTLGLSETQLNKQRVTQ